MEAANPVYLLLDRMRETQLQQTVLLEELSRSMKTNMSGSGPTSPLTKWLPLLKPIASLAAQYGTGMLLMAYVVKGGDLMTAIEVLLKLL